MSPEEIMRLPLLCVRVPDRTGQRRKTRWIVGDFLIGEFRSRKAAWWARKRTAADERRTGRRQARRRLQDRLRVDLELRTARKELA